MTWCNVAKLQPVLYLRVTIVHELEGWADRDILQRLLQTLTQVLRAPEQQKVVSTMLGL